MCIHITLNVIIVVCAEIGDSVRDGAGFDVNIREE